MCVSYCSKKQKNEERRTEYSSVFNHVTHACLQSSQVVVVVSLFFFFFLTYSLFFRCTIGWPVIHLNLCRTTVPLLCCCTVVYCVHKCQITTWTRGSRKSVKPVKLPSSIDEAVALHESTTHKIR
jgi:hypothetical protein